MNGFSTILIQNERGGIMQTSAEAFMRELIDYAGLFPPAKLPFDEAVQNYIRYQRGEDLWMLARFICPVSRLDELIPYEDQFDKQHPLRLSVLGTGGDDLASYLTSAHRDANLIADFTDRFQAPVNFEVYEVKLPQPLLERGEANSLYQALKAVSDHFISAGFASITPFIEVPFTEIWRETLSLAVRVISRLNETLDARMILDSTMKIGCKVRCGGLAENLFPTPPQLAYIIALCRDFSIPLKATAGLHHPLRHWNEKIEVMEHGFFNLVTATLLAQKYGLAEPAIIEILEDEAAANFQFNESRLQWKSERHVLAVEEIASLRSNAFVSYGSCSFDEPRDDLKQLGIL